MEHVQSVYAISAATLVAVAFLATLGLKGFNAWIALKRSELERQTPAVAGAGNRIEIADLKERVRKLEAIAAGVDL